MQVILLFSAISFLVSIFELDGGASGGGLSLPNPRVLAHSRLPNPRDLKRRQQQQQQHQTHHESQHYGGGGGEDGEGVGRGALSKTLSQKFAAWGSAKSAAETTTDGGHGEVGSEAGATDRDRQTPGELGPDKSHAPGWVTRGLTACRSAGGRRCCLL